VSHQNETTEAKLKAQRLGLDVAKTASNVAAAKQAAAQAQANSTKNKK
jgi:hypothetical protein